MSTVKTITRRCINLCKCAVSLIFILWLLVACTSGAEQGGISPPMKFTVPGGDQLLRSVDVNSIEARYILQLGDRDPEPSVMMTRIGESNQWESPPLPIPPNTGFLIQLTWSAADVSGARVSFAMQSFRSVTGVNLNQIVDLSSRPYNFDVFDDDDDGANNHDELLAGTPANGPPASSTTAGPTSGEGEGTVTVISTQPFLASVDRNRVFTEFSYGYVDMGNSTNVFSDNLYRLGESDQLQSDPIVVSPGIEYLFFITWIVSSDASGLRFAIADQTISYTGTDSDGVIDFSDQPYNFEFFDLDADGISNYDELLNNTNPEIYDELLAGTNPESADTGTTDNVDNNNLPILTPGGFLLGTLTALVEQNGAGEALGLLRDVGLAQSLNDESNAWTVFLPTDAALAEFQGTFDEQSHIYILFPSNTDELTGLSGSEIYMNSGSVVAIRGGGTEPLTIDGHEIVTADLSVEGGQTIVHIIDGVIVP